MILRKLEPTERNDRDNFIGVPYRLYRDDPHWVPRLRSEMELALDSSRHPFYQAGEAAFFLVEQEGEPIGRIAALNNHRYNEYNQARTGFFHYFECAEDGAASQALFEAAGRWLEGQGLEEMIGPKGMLQGESPGLLVEGFEHRPAMGVPYNPPFYERLIVDQGFEGITDFRSGYLAGDYQLPDRLFRIVDRVKERRGYWVKNFTSEDELRAWIPRVQEVYNRSFEQAFHGPLGFCPMTAEEVELIAERILSLARPDLIKLVLIEEELIGFLFAYPNIGSGLRRAQGRFWPLGWVHLLWERERTRWLDVNGIGVVPEHQGRGANAVLYAELAATVQGSRFEHADVVQIREENIKSMGDMKALDVQWYKRHRLYRRRLTAGANHGP